MRPPLRPLLPLLLVLLALAAASRAQERAELVRGAGAFYNERAEDPLFLPNAAQTAALLEGAVVKIRRTVPGTGGRPHERLTAWYLVERPLADVWIAALTPAVGPSDLMTELRIEADDAGNSVWYQHFDLPWPVADRQWVVDLRKDPGLYEASDGRAWEHAWSLHPGGEELARELAAAGRIPGLTLQDVEASVYLPVNHGAWILFGLDEDLTLIAYHVTASLGGRIPEQLVNTFAMAQLDDLMRRVAVRAGRLDTIYGPDAWTVYDGAGRPLPRRGARLEKRAVLPAGTDRPGPTSGRRIEGAHGVATPFVDRQPVQGFSALVPAGEDTFWVLSDNGFGSRENSPDFLLCIHRLGVEGDRLRVLETIDLRDPLARAGFPLVCEEEVYPGTAAPVDEAVARKRLLTGADFDPESLAVLADGSFLVGEEFGPFLLRFSAEGVLCEEPVGLPGVWSPQNPFPPRGPAPLPASGGFEGLCLAADGTSAYALLEKTVAGDPPGRLRLYRYDPAARTFGGDGPLAHYALEAADHFIGALAALDAGTLLVLERDDREGEDARFKRIFAVDLHAGEDPLPKRLVVDLLAVPDPDGVAGPAGSTFALPFVTLEGLAVLGPDRIAVANDNNFPFSAGRRPDRPDDNEIVWIRVDAQASRR